VTEPSRIGYGTAELGRSISARERARLVGTALEAGITYFDTAPLYGAGAAEEAIGRVVGGRDDVSVATKVGIAPAGVARIALARLLGRAAGASAGLFAPTAVRKQLEESLRRLRRERVDVLLLHEVDPIQVTPELIAALDALQREGRVDRAGIATGPAQTQSILDSRVASGFPGVVQVAASVVPDVGDAALVIHSVLAGRAGVVPGVKLLREAAHAHPGAVVLFGSRRRQHVLEAATALD
jgi:aryl-alcohol dehydrogenase-like predicted oxidoreductase